MKTISLAFSLVLLSIVSFAQDKKIDININKDNGSSWYTSPVVWIIGAAVFILLLVALLRGRSSDR